MNFSKVKLIIILCLAIVNIIFAFLCIRLISETNYISEEEAGLASSNLLKNGISAEFDKEARRLYNLPVYQSLVDSTEETVPATYKQITESFFGVKAENAAFVKTPAGYSISVKNSDGELLGSASLFDKIGFECFLSDASEYKESSELYKAPYSSELENIKDSDYDAAESFVDRAFKDYSMKFIYAGTRSVEGGKIVSFNGVLSDTPVANVYINVFVKNKKIVCCAGNVFDKVPEKKYSTAAIDSIDAVYLLTENLRQKDVDVSGTEIERISMVYDSVEYSYGEYYIVPAWIIECKNKDGLLRTYSVEAVTGEGIREIE